MQIGEQGLFGGGLRSLVAAAKLATTADEPTSTTVRVPTTPVNTTVVSLAESPSTAVSCWLMLLPIASSPSAMCRHVVIVACLYFATSLSYAMQSLMLAY
jgi:hypothetical protein